MRLILTKSQLIHLQESESFTDYPQAATNNAKKALRWKKEHGKEVKGGTAVGWARARQLANRRPLSKSTIKRMAQFARHLKNNELDPKYKSEPWKDRGRIANLIWGGASGINWARRKSKSLQKEHLELAKNMFLQGYFSVVNPSKLKLTESVTTFNKETFLMEEYMFLSGYLKAIVEQNRASDYSLEQGYSKEDPKEEVIKNVVESVKKYVYNYLYYKIYGNKLNDKILPLFDVDIINEVKNLHLISVFREGIENGLFAYEEYDFVNYDDYDGQKITFSTNNNELVVLHIPFKLKDLTKENLSKFFNKIKIEFELKDYEPNSVKDGKKLAINIPKFIKNILDVTNHNLSTLKDSINVILSDSVESVVTSSFGDGKFLQAFEENTLEFVAYLPSMEVQIFIVLDSKFKNRLKKYKENNSLELPLTEQNIDIIIKPYD